MSELKSVLVTGGDGFLGLALTRRLVEYGYRVVVMDNHSTSRAGPSTDRRRVLAATEHVPPTSKTE
ncbi:MAG: NAD-dependent epimerase/dehydratase family protein [Persicimonas sp.]